MDKNKIKDLTVKLTLNFTAFGEACKKLGKSLFAFNQYLTPAYRVGLLNQQELESTYKLACCYDPWWEQHYKYFRMLVKQRSQTTTLNYREACNDLLVDIRQGVILNYLNKEYIEELQALCRKGL